MISKQTTLKLTLPFAVFQSIEITIKYSKNGID